MRMKTLIDNAMKEDGEKDVVILLGNVKNPQTEERYKKICEFGIGKGNFDVGFSGQLLVKCPKSKFKKLTETFPIVEGNPYWQVTHIWEDATV